MSRVSRVSHVSRSVITGKSDGTGALKVGGGEGGEEHAVPVLAGRRVVVGVTSSERPSPKRHTRSILIMRTIAVRIFMSFVMEDDA